jgi:hypothetical protein
MSEGPPEEESTTKEWEPVFPWERVGEFLASTPRGQFIAYNTLLFVLVGVSFAVPAVMQYLLGTSERSANANTITIGIPLEQLLLNALYQAVVLTPILAVISGVVAGIYLGGPNRSVAITGSLGVTAGFAGLLVVLFATTLLIGADIEPRSITGGGISRPITIWVGTALSGGGSAYLTRVFIPAETTD